MPNEKRKPIKMFFIWKRFLKRLFPLFFLALVCLIYWTFLDPKSGRNAKRQLKRETLQATPNEPPVEDVKDSVLESEILESFTKLQPIAPLVNNKPEYKCKYKSSRFSDKDLSDVSPRLDKLLKRYIRLHDHQQANFTAKESVSLPMTWGNNTCRFLVYSTNIIGSNVYERFFGLFTALMMALLTDRVLLIDDDSINEAFCSPFKSNWIIDRDSFKSLADQASTEEVDFMKKRVPVKSFSLDKDSKFIQCGGYLKQVFEPVQFILISKEIDNGLNLLRSNKAYEQSWTMELFPNGLAIKPLFNSLFFPTNELWDVYNAVIKEYLPPHKRLFKIMAFVGESDDLGRIKTIAEQLRENVGVFLYLVSVEKLDDLRLKEIFPYPAYSVASAWHLFPNNFDKDQWRRLALDLQFAKSMDILLLPEENINNVLILHAIRTKKTFKFNKAGKILPFAVCDNYKVRQINCK